MNDPPDNPSVVTLPPLIYLCFFALGLILDWLWPLAVIADPLQYAVGIAVIAVSAAIAIWTVSLFRRKDTPFDVRKPTTTLITQGPLRYSRNPGYLALTLLYGGAAIAIDNAWAAGLLIPTIVVMHFGVITREESYLLRKFKDEYLDYKASVRRWL